MILLPLVSLLAVHVVALASPEEDLAQTSRLGKELMAAGRYAEAVPVYRDLVEAVPGNPGLLLNLGMALHLVGRDALLGRTGEAIPHLEQGRPADEDGSVRYQLARAYQAAGRADDARAALEDCEEFRKAKADSGDAGQAPITPP